MLLKKRLPQEIAGHRRQLFFVFLDSRELDFLFALAPRSPASSH